MSYIKNWFNRFRYDYSINEKMMAILMISIFLPYPITAVTIIGIFVMLIKQKKIRDSYQCVRRSRWLILLSIYLLIVSLVSKNYIGALISVAMFMIFSDVVFYQANIKKDFFHELLDVVLVVSLIGVIYATFEQIFYLITVDGMDHFLDIQNQPQNRVKAFYFNSNYYAMIIIFLEAICFYQSQQTSNKKKHYFYAGIALANLYALFLTGGRFAWLALIVGMLAMLAYNHWYKSFGILFCISVVLAAIVLHYPKILPRFATQGFEIGRRTEIWKTAILMITDHAFLGLGPLGYYTYCDKYLPIYKKVYGTAGLKQYPTLGIKTEHAHTLFLEPFISFGVVGIILFSVYLISELKRIVKLLACHIDRKLGSLLLGIIIMCIAFCIVDFPILWIQTGLLFLLLLASVDIYRGDKNYD